MRNLSFVQPRQSVWPWVLQSLLALLFLFAGLTKLTMPIEALVAQSGLPAMFMRFIAVSEIAGALGLILPGHFGVNRNLKPLAAMGLFIIMIGAVSLTVATQGAAAAMLPFATGILLGVVIRVHLSTAAA